jgi:hypothetical protein
MGGSCGRALDGLNVRSNEFRKSPCAASRSSSSLIGLPGEPSVASSSYTREVGGSANFRESSPYPRIA